jgi:hypothetical protein
MTWLDFTAPDPSPRMMQIDLLFGERCALNAIEAGARILAGKLPANREFLDPVDGVPFWVSQDPPLHRFRCSLGDFCVVGTP